MKVEQDLRGKQTVFVTGGSGGLGKAISKILAARGAHVTIFSRRPSPLEEARQELAASCLRKDQEINAVAIDMADAADVLSSDKSMSAWGYRNLTFWPAGGNYAENGFLVDIKAQDIDSCMKNNYYSSAYAAKSMLDIWIEEDEKKLSTPGSHPKLRQIIFINSAAAFLGLPGSIAYTRTLTDPTYSKAAKAAVRALADTLRMEVMRYCCTQSTYSIHCAFPADFVSPGFMLEQKTKTPLTKRMQGLDRPLSELEARFPSAEKVASLVITAADRGDFIICEDSLAASLLFTNM
ncbi:putative secondary metabolism biosynthetic enzyme [Myotisia sp. PD_48]|nr:putative secondary metabolism biosynthetic enzyme [Myotisia sp. PD_48]